MSFPSFEKKQMLALKGVGATVIARLEQIGFSQLAQLADQDAAQVIQQISQMMNSSCWRNSPQAKQAIAAVIALAARTTHRK